MKTGDQATAVIVAAGESTRFGQPGKTFTRLLDKPMCAWSLDAAQAATAIGQIVLVVNQGNFEEALGLQRSGTWTKLTHVVQGGASRHASVQQGVAAAAPASGKVVIHDGARPLVRPEQFNDVLAATTSDQAAICATPVVDTLKRVDDGRVIATEPREGLWQAQTPQAFPLAWLQTAFANHDYDGESLTDESLLCEQLGLPVMIVMGSAQNLKVTHPDDLTMAEQLLQRITPGDS